MHSNRSRFIIHVHAHVYACERSSKLANTCVQMCVRVDIYRNKKLVLVLSISLLAGGEGGGGGGR